MEIEKLQEYQLLGLKGRGAFAEVYHAKSKITGQQVAIKKVILKQSRDKDRQCALTQVRLLASIYHQNIIGFKDAFFSEQHQILYIVMEYAAQGDVSKKIESLKEKNTYANEEEIWKFIKHMARALKVLHDNNIIHRDLKSANIFITSEGEYKLADFNVAKLVKNYNGLADTKVGTPYYTSPEVWDSQGYGVRSDIWSLGVIVYELTCLELPFPANSFAELYQKIFRAKPNKIPSCFSDDLSRVIFSMLNKNPLKRPSADQLIQYAQSQDFKTPFKTAFKSRCSMLQTIKNPTQLSLLKLNSERIKTQNQNSICQKAESNLISNSFHSKNNEKENCCDSPVITIRDRIKSHYRSKAMSQKQAVPLLSLKSSKVNTNSKLGLNGGGHSKQQLKRQHICLKPIVLNFQVPPRPSLPNPVICTDRLQNNSRASKKILRLPSLSMHKS